jgi:hypothetical protein
MFTWGIEKSHSLIIYLINTIFLKLTPQRITALTVGKYTGIFIVFPLLSVTIITVLFRQQSVLKYKAKTEMLVKVAG